MATTTRRVRRTRSGAAAKFLQFLVLQQEENEIKRRREDLKKELIEVVKSKHEVDEDKGHLLHTLPEPVEVSGKRFVGFQHQRKATQVFLEDAAQALCEKKGFDLDEYTSRYVDQDKIVRLYADDRITDDEFNSLVEDRESWAFVPMKEG